MQKRKNNKKQKVLALILSIAMVFCYMPMTAFADSTSSGTDSGTAVAQIGDETYDTLPEAVAAAEDGDTITLLQDAEGSGVKITEANAKKLTIDFNGYTYTMNGTAVGSTGYENQAMHFEQGSNITLKNGTLKVASGSFGIQNYADLTLIDFTVDSSDNSSCNYALSINNGDVRILGSSSVIAASGKNAFDVCLTEHYPDGARVTVDTTGTITGNIQYDSWDDTPEINRTALRIKNGTFNGEFDIEEGLEDEAARAIRITGGTFTDSAAGDYAARGFVLVSRDDGTYTVERAAEPTCAIGHTYYATLADAVANAEDGDTIRLLRNTEGSGIAITAANAKKLTIDFCGHTYTMNGTAVGSTGYENQAMHFEAGSDITLKNGTLRVAKGNFGIQNYADLTLINFNVDASMNSSCGYAISCNNGDVNILGDSSIRVASGNYAFDVCLTTNYPDGARVTVDTTGTIEGNIQYDSWTAVPDENNTALTIKNGKFIGKFVIEEGLEDEAASAVNVSGGVFSTEVAAAYLADGYTCIANDNGTYRVLSSEEASKIEKQKEEKAKAEREKAQKPHKTKITKPIRGKKRFTIRWQKITGISGYQIQYSTSRSFSSKTSSVKYVTSSKATQATVSRLKSNKTYYVRIRTYKISNGKKVYSSWSTVKAIRTK
jgi:hypothetical protein